MADHPVETPSQAHWCRRSLGFGGHARVSYNDEWPLVCPQGAWMAVRWAEAQRVRVRLHPKGAAAEAQASPQWAMPSVVLALAKPGGQGMACPEACWGLESAVH